MQFRDRIAKRERATWKIRAEDSRARATLAEVIRVLEDPGRLIFILRSFSRRSIVPFGNDGATRLRQHDALFVAVVRSFFFSPRSTLDPGVTEFSSSYRAEIAFSNVDDQRDEKRNSEKNLIESKAREETFVGTR